MADTVRDRAALETLLADNTIGAISPQDLRDFLASVKLAAETPARVLRDFVFVLAAGTPATAGNDKGNAAVCSYAGTFIKAKAYAKTGPTGADLIFDINKNGTTIWTSQSAPDNRLKIAASSQAGTASAFDVTSFAEGDKLTPCIDQIGSTIAGQDITIVLTVQYEVS